MITGSVFANSESRGSPGKVRRKVHFVAYCIERCAGGGQSETEARLLAEVQLPRRAASKTAVISPLKRVQAGPSTCEALPDSEMTPELK